MKKLQNSNIYKQKSISKVKLEGKKRNELVKMVSQIISLFSEEEKQEVLGMLTGKKEGIPVSVFRTKNISGLEAITVYLKDVKELSIKEIAETLNRKTSTIYTTYQKAKQKLSGEVDCSELLIIIPLDVFANRKFSILESLVSYLKDKEKLTLIKITKLLNKNYSTVKTVYRRYLEKC